CRGVGSAVVSVRRDGLRGRRGRGALGWRRGPRLGPQVTGGPQERGLRAGTENLAAVVGFAAAARAAAGEVETAGPHMAALVERLWGGLRARVPDVVRHGGTTG